MNSSPPPPHTYKTILVILIGILALLVGIALIYIFFFREPGEPLLPIGGGVLPGTDDKTPPSQPIGLKALTSAANIVLSWSMSQDNIGVEGYYIYRDGTRIETVKTPRFTDAAVKPEMLYTYTVSAYDDAGNESTRSDVLTARATDIFDPPTSPTLTVRGETGEYITVKNFYNTADEILVYGDALIKETEYYAFLFIRFDESFLIQLKDPNVKLARAVAESDVPELLGIPQADACKLALVIGVPYRVNEQYSKEIYRLSFCPGAQGF